MFPIVTVLNLFRIDLQLFLILSMLHTDEIQTIISLFQYTIPSFSEWQI